MTNVINLHKAVMEVKPKQRSIHSGILCSGLLQHWHDNVINLRAWKLIVLRIKATLTSPGPSQNGSQGEHGRVWLRLRGRLLQEDWLWSKTWWWSLSWDLRLLLKIGCPVALASLIYILIKKDQPPTLPAKSCLKIPTVGNKPWLCQRSTCVYLHPSSAAVFWFWQWFGYLPAPAQDENNAGLTLCYILLWLN